MNKKRKSKTNDNLHVSKIITEMPMLYMSSKSRLILYTVLKRAWINFSNKKNYKPSKKLTKEDYEFIKTPVTLGLSDFKPIFGSNLSYKQMSKYILEVPKEAGFYTYYNVEGEKSENLLYVVITFFEKIEFNNTLKKIKFVPSSNVLDYIESLKAFAIIDINELKKLRGNYQTRGYEFICQYNYRNNRNEKLVDDNIRKIRIEDLRRYFEIPDTYDSAQIDKRVIKPMMLAITKNTKYNIVEVKKFKLNPENKCKVSHYRFDIEYKTEYIESLKNKKSNDITYDEKKAIVEKNFKDIWNLYPLKKGLNEVTLKEKVQVCKIGIKEFKKYIDRYINYVNERRKEFQAFNFMEGATFFKGRYIDYTDENYTKYTAKVQKNKPEQSTNFEQREYDDEFFDDLYDNF